MCVNILSFCAPREGRELVGETTSASSQLGSNLHFLEVALRAERCVSTAAAPTIINQKEEKIHLSPFTSWSGGDLLTRRR